MKAFSVWRTKDETGIPQLTTAVDSQQIIMLSLIQVDQRIERDLDERELTIADVEFVYNCLRITKEQTDARQFLVEPTKISTTTGYTELRGGITALSETTPNSSFIAFMGGDKNPMKQGILTFLLQLPD